MTFPNRGPSRAAKNKLSLSMALGTLLVPISAVAAIWLSDPGQPAQAETAPPSTTTTTAAATADSASTFDNVGATKSDLRAACGYVGMTLVDAERNGTITDIQQAALDALRDVCDEQGLSLPAAPSPDTQTISQDTSSSSASAATTTDQSSVSSSNGEHESEYDSESEHEDGGVDG